MPEDFRTESAEQTCAECHSSVIEGKVTHKAMNAGCDLCHESTGENHPLADVIGFKLVAEIPELCYFCHDDFTELKILHEPVGNCLNCHSPHNSEEVKLLTDNSQSICKSCHEDIFDLAANSLVPHKPSLATGKCIDCHSPHSSTEKRLLVAEDRKLCLSCHNKTFITREGTISNIDLLLKNNKVEHSGLDGGCSTCHLPHGSDFSKLLIDAYPGSNYANASYESFSLCFLCHDSDLLEAEFTSLATNFRNGETNLHFMHTKGVKGRSCHLCHNIHASSQEFILEESVKFGNWEMQMNFLLQDNGGSCLPGCHSRKDYSRIIPKTLN